MSKVISIFSKKKDPLTEAVDTFNETLELTYKQKQEKLKEARTKRNKSVSSKYRLNKPKR